MRRAGRRTSTPQASTATVGAVDGQRAAVRRGVDAVGAAGHHGPAAVAEPGRELGGHVLAVAPCRPGRRRPPPLAERRRPGAPSPRDPEARAAPRSPRSSSGGGPLVVAGHDDAGRRPRSAQVGVGTSSVGQPGPVAAPAARARRRRRPEPRPAPRRRPDAGDRAGPATASPGSASRVSAARAAGRRRRHAGGHAARHAADPSARGSPAPAATSPASGTVAPGQVGERPGDPQHPVDPAGRERAAVEQPLGLARPPPTAAASAAAATWPGTSALTRHGVPASRAAIRSRAAATRSATTAVLSAAAGARRAARPGWPRASRSAGRPGRAADRTAGRGSAAGPSACSVQSGRPRRRDRQPARARVGGEHQLEPGRVAHPGGQPGDGDLAGLQRLAQRVEHGRRELRRLVQEQHPAVGQRRRARAGPGPSRRRRSPRPTRCGAAPGTAARSTSGRRRRQRAGDRVHRRHLERGVAVERRQQAGQPLGQHRLAGARAARSSAGGGRRPRPPRAAYRAVGLAEHVGQVGGRCAGSVAPAAPAVGARRPARASGSSLAASPRDQPGQRPHTGDPHAGHQRRLGGVGRRDHDRASTPAAAAASTAGSTPRTGRTRPSSPSSPSSTAPSNARWRHDLLRRRAPRRRSARSKPSSALGQADAGDRLTVIRWSPASRWPLLTIAARTRSRDSASDASGSPTRVNDGHAGPEVGLDLDEVALDADQGHAERARERHSGHPAHVLDRRPRRRGGRRPRRRGRCARPAGAPAARRSRPPRAGAAGRPCRAVTASSGCPNARRRPGLDLADHQHVAVAGDDVDLADAGSASCGSSTVMPGGHAGARRRPARRTRPTRPSPARCARTTSATRPSLAPDGRKDRATHLWTTRSRTGSCRWTPSATCATGGACSRSEPLSCGPHGRVRPAAHSPGSSTESSCRASSSTLTSLNVSTRTFFTNRAGRYMSHTHASDIVTSK